MASGSASHPRKGEGRPREWSAPWYCRALDVGGLHAFYVDHAFPRHSHDYYVICLIERGLQSFTHRGTRYVTPADGVILLNPGTAHTGEAATPRGFEYQALYPTTAHMGLALAQYTGRHGGLPFFPATPLIAPGVARAVRALHRSLTQDTSSLEYESRFLCVLTRIIGRYADARPAELHLGSERRLVRQTRECLHAHIAEPITLTQLALHVGHSPYHLLRVFTREIGMPPHAYLESLRIRHAQRLLSAGIPLVQVALESGFSSQSHFTTRFRRMIGVTPGQYGNRASAGAGREA